MTILAWLVVMAFVAGLSAVISQIGNVDSLWFKGSCRWWEPAAAMGIFVAGLACMLGVFLLLGWAIGQISGWG